MDIRRDSQVKLTPLVIHRQKKNIIVEDVRMKEYYEMTPASADAIEAIQAGRNLGEIEDELKKRYPDEEIDMIQFVSDLVELGLVTELDEHVLQSEEAEEEEDVQAERREFPIFHKIGCFLFRTPVILIYPAAFIYSVWIILTKPQYGPEFHSMHILDTMTLNVLLWAGLSLFLLALHEFSHFLAARAYRIPAKYDFGHRYYFLVLETQLIDIWKLEPRQRVIPYLAGMMNDSVMLALSVTLRIVFPEMNDVLYDTLKLATFYLTIMLVFQTCVFMKTDLYYVIESLSGHLNLQERAKQWLMDTFRRRPKEQEPAFVKFFVFIYCTGIGLVAWFFVWRAYPQFMHFLDHAQDYLSYPVTDFYFWDGILFIVLNSASLAILFYSWYRQLMGYLRSRSAKQLAEANDA